jgi:small subunit ribosomal protein S20
MSGNKSAMKRVRTDAQKHLRNKACKAALKTAEKNFREAVEAKDAEKVIELGKDCFSKLDKAAKGGTIPKNKASNKKSQISKLLQSV